MNITAKATVATLGSGSIIVAGCYAGGLMTKEISGFPLNLDDNFSNTYNTDTFVGKKYGQYLIGIGENNKAGWEKAFAQYEADKGGTSPNFSSLFSSAESKVTSAYSSDANNATALNKVCGEAYKKTLNDQVDFDNTTGQDDKNKLAANILKYCSPLGKTPEIISNENNSYTEGKIGKQGNEKKLVSTTDSANNGFWQAQNKWFKEQGKNSSSSLDKYFGQFFTGNENTKTLGKGQSIKKICEEAYKKEASEEASEEATNEKPKIDDVVKYCSFQQLTS